MSDTLYIVPLTRFPSARTRWRHKVFEVILCQPLFVYEADGSLFLWVFNSIEFDKCTWFCFAAADGRLPVRYCKAIKAMTALLVVSATVLGKIPWLIMVDQIDLSISTPLVFDI